MNIFELIGWLGAVSYIIGYFLLSTKKLSSDQIIYHALNALGGICLVVNSVFLNDSPNFVVNLIWMGIAIYSIIQIFKLRFRKGEKFNEVILDTEQS